MADRRTVVIGSGIIGLAASLLRATAGADVLLLERERVLGGLLRSPVHQGRTFDIGTHIPARSGIVALDALLFARDDGRRYRAIEHLQVGSCFGGELRDRGVPDLRVLDRSTYSSLLLDVLEARGPIHPPRTGQEELDAVFGPAVRARVFDPALMKLFGRPSAELAPGAHLPFFSRILALDAETTFLLKTIPRLDRSLAYHRAEDAPSSAHRFPREGGVGAWLADVIATAEAAGVEIRSGVEVAKLDIRNKDVVSLVLADGSRERADEVIWTLPPAVALRAAGLPHSGSGPPLLTRVDVFHFEVDAPFEHDWHYVVCTDPNHLGFRVTCYENIEGVVGDRTRVSVEVVTPPDRAAPVTMETAARLVRELLECGVVPTNSNPSLLGVDVVHNGFPVQTPDLPARMREQTSLATAALENVIFLGRAASSEFLMSSLLRETYDRLTTD